MIEQANNISPLEVGEITFALPFQRFSISCAISAEETLPVVTEFSLRLIHACESLAPARLQSFFGFSEKELRSVIATLEDQRLATWQDDELTLTPYAKARFFDSPDGIPRFFKIKDWNGEVAFDLISFSHVVKSAGSKPFPVFVDLRSKDEARESRTVYSAEQAFQSEFRKIIRKERTEIYKMSSVEPKERSVFPLTCKFFVAIDGAPKIVRSLPDEIFSDKLEIAEAISDALSSAPPAKNTRILDFIETFNDDLLSRYVDAGGFDLTRYLRDVHSNRVVGYGDDTEPVLGSLYLKQNRVMLLDWTKSSLTPDIDVKKVHSACWLAPRSPFWGRSSSVRHFVSEQERALRGSEDSGSTHDPSPSSSAGIKTIIPCQPGRDAIRLSKIHRGCGPKLFGSDHNVMNGQCELFIISGLYVCALFHYVVDSAITIPIGFISRSANRIEAAAELIRSAHTASSGIFSISDEHDNSDLDVELGFILRREPRESV